VITGPRVLVGVLALLYAAFVLWYGGRGEPLTQPEIDDLFATIAERASLEPNPDGHLRDHLRTLVASDDGREFYMVNLIRYRAQAQYPPGYDLPGNALDADLRYGRAIMPYLLKHGGTPVFLSEVQGRFLHEAGDQDWDRVAIVRYRSRRDLLEMVAELAGRNVAVHKWASIEKTQVFPVKPLFSFVAVRGCIAVLLVGLGLLVHMVLRRARWYRGAPASA
jgi:hypothetical protein